MIPRNVLLAMAAVIAAASGASGEFIPPDGFEPSAEYEAAVSRLSVAAACREFPGGDAGFDVAFAELQKAARNQPGGPSELDLIQARDYLLSQDESFLDNPFAKKVCTDLYGEHNAD